MAQRQRRERGSISADDIDFDYILDSILDLAEALMAERELVVDNSTKVRT